MKKVKKLLVCMLTAIMMLTMAVPAQAGVYKPKMTTVYMNDSGRLYLGWNSQRDAAGYRVRIKDFSTNKTKPYYLKGRYNTSGYLDLNKNKAYRIEVCAYRYNRNGEPVYGTKYVKYMCTARKLWKISATSYSVKMGWNRLYGISGYRVYKSSSRSSGYRYVATLSSGATACTIYNLNSPRTYVKIIPFKSVNGTKYNLPYYAGYYIY